jgi:hypothetical protein
MSSTAEMLGQGSQPQLVQPGGEIPAFGRLPAIGRPGKAAR